MYKLFWTHGPYKIRYQDGFLRGSLSLIPTLKPCAYTWLSHMGIEEAHCRTLMFSLTTVVLNALPLSYLFS